MLRIKKKHTHKEQEYYSHYCIHLCTRTRHTRLIATKPAFCSAEKWPANTLLVRNLKKIIIIIITLIIGVVCLLVNGTLSNAKVTECHFKVTSQTMPEGTGNIWKTHLVQNCCYYYYLHNIYPKSWIFYTNIISFRHFVACISNCNYYFKTSLKQDFTILTRSLSCWICFSTCGNKAFTQNSWTSILKRSKSLAVR